MLPLARAAVISTRLSVRLRVIGATQDDGAAIAHLGRVRGRG